MLHAKFQEVFKRNTLVLRVVELVLRYELDDLSLIPGHGFQHEAESDLLVVILEGEEGRLIFQLILEILIGVHLHPNEAKAIKHLLTPEHPGLDVIHRNNEGDVLNL